MGKLIYLITTSLDGYTTDENGTINFTAPSEEVHLFIDEVLHNVGTFLFGRRLYETMAVWDTISPDGSSEGMDQFANVWKAANKIVYSTSLTEVSTANTTLEHEFDSEAVRNLLAESDKDVNIGGPHLATEAIREGLIDEIHQFIAPKFIGGNDHWLPKKVKANLELVDLRKFENGTVHLQYKRTEA